METQLSKHVIDIEGCGSVSVYVQGDKEKLKEGVVYLTLHDVGSSYQDWVNYTSHESMQTILKRAVFLHVSLPGQSPSSPDLPKEFEFPSMSALGQGLVTVLDTLRVPRVIGLGDGAGANIISRFGMNHPNRVHGIILLNPDCQEATGFIERLKDQISPPVHSGDRERNNEKNVSKFSESYKKRTPILNDLGKDIKFDVLIIAGAKSKTLEQSETIHRAMAPGCCSIIKVEDVIQPLKEAPEKITEAMLLFSQGMGLLPTLGRRMSRQDSMTGEGGRRMSMQEMDVPNIGRLALSPEAMNPDGKMEEEEEESIVNPVTMGDYDKPNIRRLSLKPM